MSDLRRTVLPLLILAPLAILSNRAQARPDDPDASARAEIAATAKAFTEAFQSGDAQALASFWTPDGDLIDLDGRVISGREAIAAEFADLFAHDKGLSMRIEMTALRFPSPGMAIEDGATSVFSADGGLPSRARYTNVLVKQNGKWLLSSVREAAYVPPNNYEHLRPLEWMIGEWAQEVSEDRPVALVAFDWSPDRNYIMVVRAMGVGDTLLDNGTERIGWDPAAKIIRTWTFEPDGGFGEGAWSREGDTWKSRMSSVLSSGSLMTSTSVVSRIDPDTITWQSTERVLDGKPVPDSPVITMRRID